MRRSKEHSAAVITERHNGTMSDASFATSTARKEPPRRRARDGAELREAIERLDRFDADSPVAVVEWSPVDLRIARWSRAAAALFGWRAEEALGKEVTELHLVHPDDMAAASAALSNLAAGRCARSKSKQRNVRRDGSVVHCEWYNSVVDKQGKAQSIVSLVLDVTERESAEQALRETKAQLTNFIEMIPHGFVTIDREWRYTEVSAQAAQEMGRTREELLGRSMWEVFPGAGREFRVECERAWAENRRRSFETYSEPLGRWYEIFLSPFDGGLSIHGHDISDRKLAELALRESERRLRTVLENTREGYAIYDADRRCEYINAAGLNSPAASSKTSSANATTSCRTM